MGACSAVARSRSSTSAGSKSLSTGPGFIVLFLVILFMADFFEDLLGESGARRRSCSPCSSAVGFFGSILLHEFGHAVVAMRNGIGISSIQLWIFGGMARMDREADSPATELKVALAGPAVTAAIAIVLAAVGTAVGRPERVLGGGRARNPIRRLRPDGAGRLAGDDQRPDPRLQPAARLSDGRRPRRPRDRLVAFRQPQLGDPFRRQPRPRLRLPLHRRRHRPGLQRQPLRRRLAGADRDGDQRLRPRGGDADRADRAASATCGSPT